jgi:uncharacterized membrane protein YgcG
MDSLEKPIPRILSRFGKSIMRNYFSKKPALFISDEETTLLESAVKDFESATGCELVYYFCHDLGDEPEKTNALHFKKLKLDQVEHQNAILISISPVQKRFAIHVGEGVLRKTKDPQWHEVTRQMEIYFKHGNNLDGLLAVKTIQKTIALEQPGHTLKYIKDEASNRPIIEGSDDEN